MTQPLSARYLRIRAQTSALTFNSILHCTSHCSSESIGQDVINCVSNCVSKSVVNGIPHSTLTLTSTCIGYCTTKCSQSCLARCTSNRSRHRSAQTSTRCSGHCPLQRLPHCIGRSYRVGGLRGMGWAAESWPRMAGPLHVDGTAHPCRCRYLLTSTPENPTTS